VWLEWDWDMDIALDLVPLEDILSSIFLVHRRKVEDFRNSTVDLRSHTGKKRKGPRYYNWGIGTVLCLGNDYDGERGTLLLFVVRAKTRRDEPFLTTYRILSECR
jgi:hypothetical protein